VSVSKAIRQKVVELLDGEISVPLFDGKMEGNPNTFVLLNISGLTNENDTFDMRVTDCNLDFDIVSVRESTVKSEVLENIGDEIKEAINPTKNTIGFSLDAPLYLVMCELASESEVSAAVTTGNKMQQSKRITFRTIVTT
jgi:hypothetical protein